MNSVKKIVSDSDLAIEITDLTLSKDIENYSTEHLLKMIDLFESQIHLQTIKHLQLKSEYMDLKTFPKINEELTAFYSE